MIKYVFALIIAVIGLFWWQIRGWIHTPVSMEEDTFIVVAKGSNSDVVAKQLFEAKIISKPWLFKVVARFGGLDKKLKAGEYVFDEQISLYDVVQKLAKGNVVYHKITLPEGMTTKHFLDIINAEKLLTGEITIDVKEGELLPETYSFVRGDSKESIVLRAKKAMTDALQKEWQSRQSDLPLKNINQLLVLASIVEKETALEQERGLVASVFVNRLIKGMKLQTDPTVIYALTNGQHDLGRLLTRKDLTVDNPFNTYKYYGLPPNPICNPGVASIKAAANPDVSDFLYFVADGNGGHNFATSLKQHNRNVQNWKKNKK